jgi:hypothetical protein
MRKLIGYSLGLCLLSVGSGILFAQIDKPPAVLVINREMLKPGKTGAMHDKSESAFVQAMVAGKSTSYYFGMTSLSGESRALFMAGFGSFADWEKDNMSIAHNATLAGALDGAAVADGDLLSRYDTSAWTYDDDLSVNTAGSIAKMRYMELTVYKVKPGHHKDWVELVKMYKAAFAKIPDAHFAVFESMYGTDNGGLYLFINPMKSMAEIDQTMSNGKTVMAAMGPDGMKKADELEAACVESVASNLFQFNPKMSYAPPSWVKEDPAFWAPK